MNRTSDHEPQTSYLRLRTSDFVPQLRNSLAGCALAVLSEVTRKSNVRRPSSALVGPVIRKLQVDSEIVPAQHGDHVLQRVAIFAADPH